jgi:CubicO group peptidase (beta-lactamase class C family)
MNSYNRLITVCVYILFLIPKLNAQNRLDTSFNKNQVEKKIDSLLYGYKEMEPGLAIGIIKNDKLVIQKQFGLANMEHQIPINSETSFHVASVSKQFTAFAILLLENEGRLSLNDDVRKYIPEMKEFENKITIQNLLTHTSGLKDQWNLLRLAGWRLNDFINNNQVLEILYRQATLNFQPNESFMYSNSGYTLLAEIVSRVSNMSFSNYTKKYIFIPLEMYNTQFVDQEGQIIKNKSNSYYKEDSVFVEDVFNNTSVGATNLSTTIEDLSKWTINFSNQKIGDSKIFEKMESQVKLNNGESYGYANGQFINEYNGWKRIEHSGQDASYQAYLARFPDLNLSLIFMNNNSRIDGSKLIKQLTDICLNGYIKDEQKNSVSPNPLVNKNSIRKNIKELQTFEGHYWNDDERYSRQIKIENDTLFYIKSKTDKTALIPVDENEFEMKLDEYVGVSFNADQMSVKLDDGYKITLHKYVPVNYNLNSLKEFEGDYYSPELNTYYNFYSKNNSLVANHLRLGNFKLTAIKNDYFIGDKGSFQKVVFLRDKSKKIKGFKVSSSRANNVQFNKVLK